MVYQHPEYPWHFGALGPMSSRGQNFTKGIFSQLEGRLVHAHLSTEKKLRAKKLVFIMNLKKIETTTMEYLIAELARNLMNQKNIWNQIPNSKQLHFHMRKHQHRKS